MSRSGLSLASCMSPNMVGAAEALAAWLSQHGPLPVTFDNAGRWQDRQDRFERGQLDMLWICGLPYIRWADTPGSSVVPLAAPVMRPSRYRGKPVYYSEVLVPAASPQRTFDDLRGACWGYNEPGSHSGFGVVVAHLAQSGRDWGFFGRVVETGSHLATLDRLRRGTIEAAAVDSTVWERAKSQDPTLAAALRTIETLGPSPAPPIVIRRQLAGEVGAALRAALVGMAERAAGQRLLAKEGLRCWAVVEDADYDPIRRMAAEANSLAPPKVETAA